VPVVDEDGRVIGIFGESDGLRADPHGKTLVTSAMSTPVEVVAPDTDLATIAERMLVDHLRALPVVVTALTRTVCGVTAAALVPSPVPVGRDD
jgi:CBS domain-containing protein